MNTSPKAEKESGTISWLSTPINQGAPKQRRCKINKIQHAIFEECAKITEDPLWKGIFISASIGKLPRGFMIRNGTLTNKKGNKIISLEIPDNPKMALDACVSFFQRAGILSTKDQERINKRVEDYKKTDKTLQQMRWDEIRQKRVKELLLSNYIRKLCKKHRLRNSEVERLKETIHVAFLLDKLGNDNIIFENGKISNITGIEFNQETREFIIAKREPKRIKNSTQTKDTQTCEHKDDSLNLLEFWGKYLDLIRKDVYPNESLLNLDILERRKESVATENDSTE